MCIKCIIQGITWAITEYDDDILYTYYIGQQGLSDRITVLDRLTGYTGYIRDIETGYKDIEGKFWLVAGNFDIRNYPELTIEEAIAKIKKEANLCRG
jgi:hypothetical protein